MIYAPLWKVTQKSSREASSIRCVNTARSRKFSRFSLSNNRRYGPDDGPQIQIHKRLLWKSFCYDMNMNKEEIIQFVESQKSLHLYKNIQEALIEVLSKHTREQLEKIRNDLIIMAFHDGISGQVMHFPARNNKFVVMQLYVPNNMPGDVLRWVIAHELGHVMQGRNWMESDGNNLEVDATEFADKTGYPKTDKIAKWLSADNS